MKEAMFYTKKEQGTVQCLLCSHRCVIKQGKRGICGVRENRAGTLYSLAYGRCIAQNIDPIEKKPLYHFCPGSDCFSLATVGCNFRCKHCQNYSISQVVRDGGEIRGAFVAPEQVVEEAKEAGVQSIAYTYTEPTIFCEYAYDIGVLAKEHNLKNVFVTNGYISPEALRFIHPVLDAANVDLKSYSDEFYRKICGARLQPVLESLRLFKELGIWLEITTLVIPTYNDSDWELHAIAEFILSLGPETPWHISAYHPTYKLNDQPRTSVDVLRRAREIGIKSGLRYVYEGNVSDEKGENTYCYSCGSLVIKRAGFRITHHRLKNGACMDCGTTIDGAGLW